MTEPTEPTKPKDPPSWLSPLITVGGLVVGVWGAVLLGLLGAFLTPYRLGGVLVPIAILLVIAGNVLLLRFTHDATGNRLLGVVPGLVWLTITLILSSRTTEGDLVLASNNWVATVYLFAGSITLGVTAYRMFTPPRPGPHPGYPAASRRVRSRRG